MTMNVRLETALANNPALGWIVSVVNWLIATFAWFADHADGILKVIAFGGAIFGALAGYYTMRIQRRAWKQGGSQQPKSNRRSIS